MALRPDNATAVLGKRHKKHHNFAVVDLTTGQERCTLGDGDLRPLDVVLSSDGERVVARTLQGGLVCWNAENGKQLWYLGDKDLQGIVDAFAFSPDARLAVSAKGVQAADRGDMRLVIWDIVEGKRLGELSRPEFPVPCALCRVQTDGKLIAVSWQAR